MKDQKITINYKNISSSIQAPKYNNLTKKIIKHFNINLKEDEKLEIYDNNNKRITNSNEYDNFLQTNSPKIIIKVKNKEDKNELINRINQDEKIDSTIPKALYNKALESNIQLKKKKEKSSSNSIIIESYNENTENSFLTNKNIDELIKQMSEIMINKINEIIEQFEKYKKETNNIIISVINKVQELENKQKNIYETILDKFNQFINQVQQNNIQQNDNILKQLKEIKLNNNNSNDINKNINLINNELQNKLKNTFEKQINDIYSQISNLNNEIINNFNQIQEEIYKIKNNEEDDSLGYYN